MDICLCVINETSRKWKRIDVTLISLFFLMFVYLTIDFKRWSIDHRVFMVIKIEYFHSAVPQMNLKLTYVI